MNLSSGLLQVNTDDAPALSGKLSHQLTMLCNAEPSQYSGQTVWSTPTKSAVLCWKWGLTTDGIVVLADPREIRSNVHFVEDSRALPFERQLVAINELVNGLPWQQSVNAHLESLGLRPSAPGRSGSGKRSAPRTYRGSVPSGMPSLHTAY